MLRRAVGLSGPRCSWLTSSATYSSSAIPSRNGATLNPTSASAASPLPSLSLSFRSYSSTRSIPLCKKVKKYEEDPEVIAMVTEQDKEDGILAINTEFTQAELEQLMDEEVAEIEQRKEEKLYKNWKPGERKRPLTMSYKLSDFEEELNPDTSIRTWKLGRDKRCGAIGIKLGMVPVWDDWGERHACTVVYLDSNVVMGHKNQDKHGYTAVQLAAGERKKKNVGKCVLGQYAATAVEELVEHPPYTVREFRVTTNPNGTNDETANDTLPPIGSRIHARHFVPGQNVDVAGISKGKGFQGAMKRHGFAGMPATHGTSKSHRALGSTGQCQDPGKVFKGKKMAGRMGVDRVTKQNLRILKIDRGRNLLYIKGAIAGQKGNFVEIRDAVKKPLWSTNKVLDALRLPPLPTFPYDETVDGSGETCEEFMPLPMLDPLDPDAEEVAA